MGTEIHTRMSPLIHFCKLIILAYQVLLEFLQFADLNKIREKEKGPVRSHAPVSTHCPQTEENALQQEVWL